MASVAPDERSTPLAGTSITDAIGATPLVRLASLSRDLPNVELYAKLEARNPGGSVKDRAARRIVLDAERSGALADGRILLDATSGNTGIAYAMLGAARGHAVTLCMPENVSPERTRILDALGAHIVVTSPLEGSDGAIREARRLARRFPDRYFYADQYGNPSNWRAHYDTTAPEIFAQTAGRITHLVAGLGTSGTFVGTGRRLRELRPDVRLVSVQPAESFHGLDGLKHMASAIVPTIYDRTLADENLGIETEDAHRTLWRLWREEGVFAGISSGAALAAALRVAARSPGAVIVCICPDGGERYLSSGVWNDRPSTDRGGRRDAMDMLVLGPGIDEAIRRHAADDYPHECCGALIGRGSRIIEAFALPNTTDEGPRRRFLVRPADYRAAERQASILGAELLGFYHSHPDHPAVPSQYDLDHAWPSFAYVIVSVANGEARDLRSWRLCADRSGFDEEDVRLDD